MKRFKPQIRQILMVGLLLNMIALSVPLLILLVHERVISIGETAPLIYLAKGVAIIVAVEYLLRRARSKLLTWITSRLDFIVGSASFDRLVNLNSSIVGRAGVSEQIARIKTFESIRDFLCGPVMVTAIEIPTALFALLLLAFLGGKIVYVALVGMVLFCGLFALVWYRVRVRIKEAAIETSRVQQFTLDCLERIEAIRLDGLSDRWEERYREISGREQIANFRLGQTGIHGEIAAQFLTGLLVIAAVYVGTNLIWVGELGAGALITCMMLLLRGLAPLHALCGMIPRLEQMRNAIAQIDQLMDIETETRYEPRALTPSNLKGEGRIGFANVTFRYPKQAQMVLSGLDFEASPGEVLAITGPNGSGKSSILKLVLGLYPPLLGAVRLDGFDIRQLDPHELREQISYVPQEIDLFAGTIAENLRLGMPLATDEDLQACLEQAGAWGSVSAQPAGMETVIDPQQIAESDPLLRERIGLARGLLRPSSVLLIDERPSSSLLAGLDGDLRSCIDRLRGKKTIIFVSYRTDMLRIADRVIALRPGGRAVIGTLDKIVGQV